MWIWMLACARQETPDESRLDDLEHRVGTLESALELAFESAQPKVTPEHLAALEERIGKSERGQEMICQMYADTQPPRPKPTPARGPVPPIPSRMSAFVTDAVIARAIADASDVKSFGYANYIARNQAFAEVASLGGHELHHPTYDLWRARILEVVRRELRDPDRLWATYQRHKPAIVEGLRSRAQGTNELVLRQRRLFQGPIPDAVANAVEEVDASSEAWQRTPREHACFDVQRDRYRRAVAAMDATGWEAEAVKWRWRREAEGGLPLLATWERIFADLGTTLQDIALGPR